MGPMKAALKVAVALPLLFLIACGSSNKPVSKPPDLTNLEYRDSFVLTRPAGQTYLEVKVPGSKTYQTPQPGQDCNLPMTVTQNFAMENDTDFMDVVLNDRDGIGGAPTDAKSYTLSEEGPNSQTWTLIMKQNSSPTDYLHIETWRMQRSAVALPIQNEVGDGSDAAPPAGSPPWPRPFQGTIGGTYRLYSLNGLVNSGLTASVTFWVVKKNVTICP